MSRAVDNKDMDATMIPLICKYCGNSYFPSIIQLVHAACPSCEESAGKFIKEYANLKLLE